MQETKIPEKTLNQMQAFYNQELLKNLETKFAHEPMGEDEAQDPVHPNHYKLPGGMEVIGVEVAMFGKEWVQHHCICTAVEYLLRHTQKNSAEDVKKAKWWIDKWCELEGES